jgi:hypothetical protein
MLTPNVEENVIILTDHNINVIIQPDYNIIVIIQPEDIFVIIQPDSTVPPKTKDNVVIHPDDNT